MATTSSTTTWPASLLDIIFSAAHSPTAPRVARFFRHPLPALCWGGQLSGGWRRVARELEELHREVPIHVVRLWRVRLLLKYIVVLVKERVVRRSRWLSVGSGVGVHDRSSVLVHLAHRCDGDHGDVIVIVQGHRFPVCLSKSQGCLSSLFLFILAVTDAFHDVLHRLPGGVVVQNDVVGGESLELWREKQLDVEAVEEEILEVGRLVAPRANPLRLLLIHLQVEVCVKALQVVAGRRSTG